MLATEYCDGSLEASWRALIIPSDVVIHMVQRVVKVLSRPALSQPRLRFLDQCQARHIFTGRSLLGRLMAVSTHGSRMDHALTDVTLRLHLPMLCLAPRHHIDRPGIRVTVCESGRRYFVPWNGVSTGHMPKCCEKCCRKARQALDVHHFRARS